MEAKRRIVLVPLPAHGHVTPIMQLGKALSLNGFAITVAQVEFNQVSSQNFGGFQFVTIARSLPESEGARLGYFEFLIKSNKANKESFKNCIAQLLLQHGNDIACIIYDKFMYFCEAAAKEFKIPCAIFFPSSATDQVSNSVLGKLDYQKFLVDMEDREMQDKMVENLHPLKIKYKDLLDWGFGSLEPLLKYFRKVVKKRTASVAIINTSNYLENASLSFLRHELGIPVYPICPLHITASVSSSFLEEDKRCIDWLNKQEARSVLYVSMGSLFQVETQEVLEMAWGLSNSNQPFLWVIREGSILGCNGIESLMEEVHMIVSERGCIVKWAPQIEVLGHPAVGGFWSHCGWNSTLESIVEGVPMICRPFQGEQKLNAMYIENVWRVGIRLDGDVERGVVERAVKRLILSEEGACMRERALVLKEKLKSSVRSGGSSYNALNELLRFLESQ